MFDRPVALLKALTELRPSRGVLHLILLAVAMSFSLAGWIRPPLSADIGAFSLPLGLPGTEVPSGEVILRGTGQPVVVSVGSLLLIVILVAMAVLWCWPDRFGLVAGLLFCVALCGNAVAAIQYPSLIELLDREYEQRARMSLVLVDERDSSLSVPNTARVAWFPSEDTQRADLSRGFGYLKYGLWLLMFAALSLLWGSHGSLPKRLTLLAIWGTLGMVLSIGLCHGRLLGEYYWVRAKYLEGQGALSLAGDARDESINWCPEFRDLQRTWLLTGKLDYQAGLPSPFASFYRAYQCNRTEQLHRRLTHAEDLPWHVPSTNVPLAQRQTLALMANVLAVPGRESAVAARRQSAHFWTELGISYYTLAPDFTDTGLIFTDRARETTGAQEAWRRGEQMDPDQRQAAFFLGLVEAFASRGYPGRAEHEFAPALDGLADRTLRADILATLGDAYFRAGDMTRARRCYAESSDAFFLPKNNNHRALRGMGGL